MKKLAKASSGQWSRLPYFDAVSILGYGSPVPAPQGKGRGNVCLSYGCWSILQLAQNAIIRERQLFRVAEEYGACRWLDDVLQPGYYFLNVSDPRSVERRYDAQARMCRSGQRVAPAVLVLTALLCDILAETAILMKIGASRCAETGLGRKTHVDIRWEAWGYAESVRQDLGFESEEEAAANVYLRLAETDDDTSDDEFAMSYHVGYSPFA